MSDDNNIITLRFFGNEVTPNSFSAKELGLLIIAFHDGVKDLIDTHYPTIDSDDVRISLVEIENKSQSLKFAISERPEVHAAFVELGESIASATYTDLPQKTFNTVKQIHGVTKRKNCSVELVEKGEQRFLVNPGGILIEQKKVLIKSNMVLYGDLTQLRGNPAKAWVHLYDGSKISFTVNDAQLRILRDNKLNEPIGISGQATWNALSKKVVSFKLAEIIPYKPFNIDEGFSALKNLYTGWDDLNAEADIYSFLNGEA
jgi:hypothetical protein